MYMYRISDYYLKIEKYKIIKETPKQYTLTDNRKVNKSCMGKCDSFGYVYGLTEEEVINICKKHIENEIKEHESYIKDLKSRLDKLNEIS